MSCPFCGAYPPASAAFCAGCGFSLRGLQAVVGEHRVQLADSLIDPAKTLRLTEFQDLSHHVDEFERRFPQVKVTVFLGDLPTGVDARGAAIWLVNQGAVTRQGVPHPAEWTVALIINPNQSHASIGVGYALESLLPAEKISELLAGVSHHLRHREYGRAVRGLLNSCQQCFMGAGKPRARRLPDARASEGDHLGLPPMKVEAREPAEPSTFF